MRRGSPGRSRAALLCLAVLGSLSAGLALPRYRTQAVQQLHYDVGNPLWNLDRRVMGCTYCHVQDSGGAPWNAFGQALQRQFREDAQAGKARKFPEVLHAVLSAGRDADGDGYSDALEVYARTLPGDPASRPTRPVAELRADYERAGGAAQYRPGAPKPTAPKKDSPAPADAGKRE